MIDYSESTVKLNNLQKLLDKALLHGQINEAYVITKQMHEVLYELQDWIVKHR